MKAAGRKNFRRASKDEGLSLQEGQSIMQVVSLRGSNVIEVMDAEGVTSLALFPAKFQRSFWIKRGNFVVVDQSGREKALESGSKIACIVSLVLFHEQVRLLEKSSDWPVIFRTTQPQDNAQQPVIFRTTQPQDNAQQFTPVCEEVDSDGEDHLPPLEANLNRNRPVELYSDSDSDPVS